MAGRRCDVLDVREMLRRLRLGESARAVAKGLGVSRNTVREYAVGLIRSGRQLDYAACLSRAALSNSAGLT